ncbi:MAG TPA: SMP-30/gluconolactonase/LRE family protein [Candidatus Hydrogenedentes bacterium]|nr:SMP-30/gluconolactonase/LRE family protein [Candidatus Hydrogenedentota bacterium]
MKEVLRIYLSLILALDVAFCVPAGAWAEGPEAGYVGPVSLIAEGAKPVKVADGLTFGEGPAADGHGNVFFTDIPKQTILKLSPDGEVSVVREKTGGANGLMFDKEGDLYACEMFSRRVTKMSREGELTVVAERCDGKRFNMPNDLWIDARGGIYFTDPIYGDVDPREMAGEDVYYVKPGQKAVVRVADGLVKPNGIIGTRDGRRLYVADHGGDKTYVFDIEEDGALANKRLFVARGSDGMTLDAEGNIYLTGGKNVEVFDSSGRKREVIAVPETTTNVAFGGKERSRLYITCPNALYALDMRVQGQ